MIWSDTPSESQSTAGQGISNCERDALPELDDNIAPAYVGNNQYWKEEQYEI